MKSALSVFCKSTAVVRVSALSLVLAAAICLLAGPAYAHDPGLSAVELKVASGIITAEMTFARSDLQSVVESDSRHPAPEMEELARDALEVFIEGAPARVSAVSVTGDDSGAVHFHLEFMSAPGSRLILRSKLLGALPRGHRQYLAVRGERGVLLSERVLDASSDEIELSFEPISPSRAGPFHQFLVLGIEHILTGYDHLAFLLGLMIAGASFRAVAKIITSFTVAHSVTLALATFNLVRVSPAVVEPLIAASIVYVGLENMLRRDLKRRWLLTFAFGLIHGLGFAAALRELGIGSMGASAVVPLLSFNVGVELGQISIAAVVLPLIWKLRKRPGFVRRLAPACSVLIVLAGAVWFLQRVLG